MVSYKGDTNFCYFSKCVWWRFFCEYMFDSLRIFIYKNFNFRFAVIHLIKYQLILEHSWIRMGSTELPEHKRARSCCPITPPHYRCLFLLFIIIKNAIVRHFPHSYSVKGLSIFLIIEGTFYKEILFGI